MKKILTVCGLGQGTSLILRMNVESVLDEMGIEADVEHMDVSSARSVPADIVILSQELSETFGDDSDAKVIIVNNYFDEDEIKESLSGVINN